MRFTVAPLVVAFAFLLGACSGGGSSSPAPSGGVANATRDTSDGLPGTTSTVVVRFNRPVSLVSNKVPLASHFELAVPRATATDIKTDRVLVKSATQSEDDKRTVTLKIDRLIPVGATIKVPKSAFERDARGTIEITVESDLDVIGALLGSKALAVGDPGIIEGGEAVAVTATDRDSAAMREQLAAHLKLRGIDDEAVNTALARYDSIPVDIVESPKLRAALAGLTGTFAEPAIDSLLTGNNCTKLPASKVLFQVPPDFPNLFARVTKSADGRRVVSINPVIEGEPFQMLMPILLHEAIHCDQVGGRFEEVAATAIDSMFYIYMLFVEPELATRKSPLAREYNVDAIALINSGRAVPESIGILKSPGVTRALPATTAQFPSFGDLVVAAYPTIDYNDSPQEPLAQEYVTRLAEVAELPVKSAFDLVYLDELIGRAMAPQALAAAIVALRMTPES